MKKIASLLLVLVLAVGMIGTAAAENSTFLNLIYNDASTPLQSDYRTITCALGVCDAVAKFDMSVSDMSFTKSYYVGKYGNTAVDIYIPKATYGYYNLTWYPSSNSIYIYNMSSAPSGYYICSGSEVYTALLAVLSALGD